MYSKRIRSRSGESRDRAGPLRPEGDDRRTDRHTEIGFRGDGQRFASFDARSERVGVQTAHPHSNQENRLALGHYIPRLEQLDALLELNNSAKHEPNVVQESLVKPNFCEVRIDWKPIELYGTDGEILAQIDVHSSANSHSYLPFSF
jgi:hypothetical protein